MNPETAKLYSKSPTKPVRPTIAPEVIVEHVSANANWNSQKAKKNPARGLVSGWRAVQENQFSPIIPLP